MERNKIEVQGQTFHYFETGKGQGQTLVLFAGFGEGAKNLLRLAPFLIAGLHLICMETPGFVEGERLPLAEYRLDLQVKRLQRCFQAMGLTRFAIGGNSSGGNLATAYGLSHASEITHLVLLAPQGIESAELAPYSQKPTQVETIPQFDQMMAELYHQPPFLSATVKEHLIAKMSMKFTWLNQLREVIRSGPFAVLNEALPDCKIPSLVLWGKSDGRIPLIQGKRFSQLLPDCQYYEMEEVGHLPQLEAPQETSALILQFMRK